MIGHLTRTRFASRLKGIPRGRLTSNQMRDADEQTENHNGGLGIDEGAVNGPPDKKNISIIIPPIEMASDFPKRRV